MSTIATEEKAPNPSPEIIEDNHPKMSRADLLSKLISQELDLMTSNDVSPEAAKDRIDQLYEQINKARTKFNELQTKNKPSSSSSTIAAAGNGGEIPDLELERDLQLLNKEVSVLKSMFPFCVFKKPNTIDPHINWRDRSTPHFVSAFPDKLMQNLIANDIFNHTPTFQELEASVQGINYFMRRILACFLVFPQNAIMKKSLLVRWAELPAAGAQGTQPIQDLITKGLIHPVSKETLVVGGYWMHPFVRSTLSDHNWLQVLGQGDTVYVTDDSSEDIFYDDPAQFLAEKELSMLHLGNWQRSSVRHIEVEDLNSFFKDMATLSKLRYVSLCGVSLVTEMPEFITKLSALQTLDLKACHDLEVLSSGIGNLGSSLTHLDMSECYFLENMPMALSSLRSLRVLKGFVIPEDIRENSCTLRDLLSMQDLMKLNIYTSARSFPNEDELLTLTLFSSLRSLTISWGGCSLPKKGTGCNSGDFATRYAIEEHQQPQEEKRQLTTRFGRLKRLIFRGSHSQSAAFPHVDSMKLYNKLSLFKLDKLDLQCVPETVTPDWLKPANFENLRKLYIRGGRFCDLGQEDGKIIKSFFERRQQEEEHIKETRRRSPPRIASFWNSHLPKRKQMDEYQWNVEILRLKHLENLAMDYRVLRWLFPKLICLENVKCPNLENFPCNDSVWKDTTTSPPTTHT